ncbi:DUF1240 domain-containing protein [Providencia rettgeri]|uniref:DUF1240 domain-containing protein n=1 Tax=Providencia rettgeri TaxID=587 RepID=UPI0034E08ADE
MDNNTKNKFNSLFFIVISLLSVFISLSTYIQYLRLEDKITLSLYFTSLIFVSPFTLYLSFIFYRAAKSSSEIKLNNQIFKYLLFIAIIGLLISLVIFLGMKNNLLSKGYIRCTDKSSTMVTTYTIDKKLCEK